MEVIYIRSGTLGHNWLRNLLQHMRGTSFEDFHTNKVSFVTFNYDRSLEHFLCRSLANSFAKTEAEAGEVISKIPIIHLHGRLAICRGRMLRAAPTNR